MRVLLVSHQLDYSGAPLALLELAVTLREAGHEVFLAALASGPLGNDFLARGIRPYQSRSQVLDLYVANTVVAVPAALALAPSPDRVLAWIHETAFFFRILRASPRDYSLDRLRFAAFPARFQIDEFARWIPDAVRMQLRNCVRMPPVDPAVAAPEHYVCSGRWEARKNQARLVELAEANGKVVTQGVGKGSFESSGSAQDAGRRYQGKRAAEVDAGRAIGGQVQDAVGNHLDILDIRTQVADGTNLR